MAYMGFVEVIRHLSDVRRNFRIAQEALLRERPDLLILIDYPSFNLRMAAYCREHLPHTRIFYYIPPKVWAWKKWRVHKIAKLSDAIFGIFPFEPAFYQRYGYRCTYVGNPCVAEIGPAPLPDAPRSGIAILPGSRPGEIKHCLPKAVIIWPAPGPVSDPSDCCCRGGSPSHGQQRIHRHRCGSRHRPRFLPIALQGLSLAYGANARPLGFIPGCYRQQRYSYPRSRPLGLSTGTCLSHYLPVDSPPPSPPFLFSLFYAA